MMDKFAGHEIARQEITRQEIAAHENAGHENAGHEHDGPYGWGCSRCTRSPMLGVNGAWALSHLAVELLLKNSNLFDHGTLIIADGQTDNFSQ